MPAAPHRWLGWLVRVAVLGRISRAQLAVEPRARRAGAVAVMAGVLGALKLDRRVPDLILLKQERADAVQDGGARARRQIVNHRMAGERAHTTADRPDV